MAAKIKIYTLSTCSHCKATKKFLNDNSITFESVDVDLLQGEERQKMLEEVMQFNPDRSFPTIIIGDKVIIGFKENAIKEVLGI
ncbi:MAG: glutaredoxin family protein [Syntrophaceae bacterium]|nr:glutaredoxin family protein [Syntrophaceae bacterium]